MIVRDMMDGGIIRSDYMNSAKNIIFGALLIFTCAHADTETPFGSVKSLKSGIQYVNENSVHVPDAMLKEVRSYKVQMQTNGYINKENDFVPELLNQRRDAAAMLRESDKIQDKFDTHLHRNLSDLKLSFTFNGLPDIKKEDIIGYAVGGSYIKKPGKPEGWDGVAVLFESNSMGSCRFDYDHIVSAYVDRASVTFDINKKPTMIFVEGTAHTGFLYTVMWYTDKTKNERMTLSEIKCARKKLENNIPKKMVEYAKILDKSIDS